MSKISEPRYKSVSWSSDEDHPDIICPVCENNAIISEPEEAIVSPCSHLAFILIYPYEGYEYESDDFKSRRGDKEYDPGEGYLDFLIELGYDQNMFVYEVTYWGGGPMTNFFGFDCKV